MKIIQRFREEYAGYDDIKDFDTYKVKDRDELRSIVRSCPNDADLNFLDVSEITDMNEVFGGFVDRNEFNGDISQWDVGHVTNMEGMFKYSEFNGDISSWDVSHVTDMSFMFRDSRFTGDISSWDVSSVTNMEGTFGWSKFNGDISNWDVSNVTDMSGMFNGSQFNGDISKWDVSKVKDMRWMFRDSKNKTPKWYNRDIQDDAETDYGDDDDEKPTEDEFGNPIYYDEDGNPEPFPWSAHIYGKYGDGNVTEVEDIINSTGTNGTGLHDYDTIEFDVDGIPVRISDVVQKKVHGKSTIVVELEKASKEDSSESVGVFDDYSNFEGVVLFQYNGRYYTGFEVSDQ